jgi:hypothetical protein
LQARPAGSCGAPPGVCVGYNFWLEKALGPLGPCAAPCSGQSEQGLGLSQSFSETWTSQRVYWFLLSTCQGQIKWLHEWENAGGFETDGWLGRLSDLPSAVDCVAIWMKIPQRPGFYFSNLWMTAAPLSPWRWGREQLPAIMCLPSGLSSLPLWIFLVPFSERECHSRLISWWCKWFSRADEYQWSCRWAWGS